LKQKEVIKVDNIESFEHINKPVNLNNPCFIAANTLKPLIQLDTFFSEWLSPCTVFIKLQNTVTIFLDFL
jgi:hypothetical protein